MRRLRWREALAILATALAAHAAPAVEEREGAGEPSSVGATPGGAASPRDVWRLGEAYRMGATDIEERTERMRRASLELGVWSFDAAAHALDAAPGDADRVAAARAAVELAPDLPSAHMSLARELWLQGDSPMAALRAVVAGLRSIGRHLEASLWFGGSGLFLLAVALVGGGLLCAFVAVLHQLPHAAHDLGHLFSRRTPGFARAALLCALLLVPLAIGEGALGLALALIGVATLWGGRAQRIAMALAAAGIALGAHPVARHAGVALAALAEDPVASAAHAVNHGFATPMEISRLVAAGDDRLAWRALAIHARRRGNLGEADAIYQRLIGDGSGTDVSLLNNAANVRLELGHMESAIGLYELAVAREESPIVLFNMAQAHGRAFQVEDLNRRLSRAQELGGELVARITGLQGTDTVGFVVDLPIPGTLFYERTLAARPGGDVARAWLAPFAPGRLGSDPLALGGAAALVVVIGAILGSRLEPSRSCTRCGGRICSRCEERGTAGELCDGCNQLFYHPERTDRALRTQRVNELRLREQRVERLRSLCSVLVPGAAGLLAKRPVSCWLGASGFTLAVAALVWRHGVVPDPLVAGTAAPTVFLGVATLAALLHVLAVATSMSARRKA